MLLSFNKTRSSAGYKKPVPDLLSLRADSIKIAYLYALQHSLLMRKKDSAQSNTLHFLSALCIISSLMLTLTSKMNAQAISPVSSFGSNPGALNMYKYVPAGISGSAPLVVALHGCTETAASFALQTGWNKLADLHKFYVIYPEQVSANNGSLCFNWFDTTDVNKNVGEALSVKQMVDYMKTNYSINPSAVYVTGISAGGGMTTVMMATYPDVFKSGAVMSGIPYKAAVDPFTALTAMNTGVVKTPAQWGALVRAQNPGYANPYPHVAIFHGTADATVNIANATEIIKQWTNLTHADQTVDSVNNAFQGNTAVQLSIYNDSSANPVVYFYKVTGMSHAIAVDTGSCTRQGGATGTYAVKEVNFHSTYWAADFFNLIPGPYIISGPITVTSSASNQTFSVPSTSGSTYLWSVPPGATIVSGQGTNSINVTFGSHSGYVQVTETVTGGCRLDAAKLYVNVGIVSVVELFEKGSGKIYYNPSENTLTLVNIAPNEIKSLRIVNLLGQIFNESTSLQGNKIILSDKLPPGIYLINASGTNTQYITKVAIP
jgi:poly(hydroxyalkanoate) depolymerase family esterase